MNLSLKKMKPFYKTVRLLGNPKSQIYLPHYPLSLEALIGFSTDSTKIKVKLLKCCKTDIIVMGLSFAYIYKVLGSCAGISCLSDDSSHS